MLNRTYEFVQLDVFTRTPRTGNPLVVFTDARGLIDSENVTQGGGTNVAQQIPEGRPV